MAFMVTQLLLWNYYRLERRLVWFGLVAVPQCCWRNRKNERHNFRARKKNQRYLPYLLATYEQFLSAPRPQPPTRTAAYRGISWHSNFLVGWLGQTKSQLLTPPRQSVLVLLFHDRLEIAVSSYLLHELSVIRTSLPACKQIFHNARFLFNNYHGRFGEKNAPSI